MNPRLRILIVGILAALLALFVGVSIANESYLLALGCSAVICWALAERFGGALPDAWLVAGALLGYIAGNRGFAQLQLAPGLPLFPAEAVLLVAVPALLARLAQKHTQAFRRDPLNYAVVLWVVLGAARLPVDFSRHGFLAARDFAMVYYTAFFFLGQAFAAHAGSARLLRRALTAGCLALPLLAPAFRYFPDFFLGTLTVRGIPLVYYKDDLLATLFAAAFFWLWTCWETRRRRAWLVPVAACLLMIGTTSSPRAAMVAVAGVTATWLLARRWQIAAAQTAVIGTATLIALLLFALSNRDLRETAAYSTYENVVSIFDYEAKGRYTNRDSGDPGDNNRFRLVWWHAVADESLAESPVFGLGFGHDLAARFLADYGLLGADDFSARSPHSMVVTVFGRLGFAGLACWLAVAAGMAGMTRRIFRHGTAASRGLASVAWVIWISACFGVVLEGPMGAVVFWTVLGLANASVGAGPEVIGEENAPIEPAHLPTAAEQSSPRFLPLPLSLPPRP
ncbi:MAG: hypothetical protein H7343_06200 [Undibacterium sp.]|nr:hypothetical protein [Opitutaceae bacterium]